jgi:hypothetical protein
VFLGEAEFEKSRTTLKSFQFSDRPLSAGLRREQSFPPSVIKTSPESTSRRSLCILIDAAIDLLEDAGIDLVMSLFAALL